jgi:hypothetical protein
MQPGMMQGGPMASSMMQTLPVGQMQSGGGPLASSVMPAQSAVPLELANSPAAQSGARSMTLSGASGEASAKRRKPASVLIGFASAMLLGSMSMVTVKALRGSGPTVVATPKVVSQVKISVKTEPADAEIEQIGSDGKELHKAPYTFTVKKDSGPVSLKIRAAGYQEESRELATAEDQNLEITLAKQEKAAEPATTDTGSTPKQTEPTPVKAPKEGKASKEPKEPKEGKTVKEPKEAKPPKEPKETKASSTKEPKEGKAVKESKEAKPPKDKGKKKKEDLMAPVF